MHKMRWTIWTMVATLWSTWKKQKKTGETMTSQTTVVSRPQYITGRRGCIGKVVLDASSLDVVRMHSGEWRVVANIVSIPRYTNGRWMPSRVRDSEAFADAVVSSEDWSAAPTLTAL